MSRAESIIKTFDKLCAEARTAEHRYDTLRILVEDWETVSSYISEVTTSRDELLRELKAMVERFSGYQGMELMDAKAAIANAEATK